MRQNTKATFDDPSLPSNDGSGWTNEECRSIIATLYDSGSTVSDIEGVINSKLWVGMRSLELWYSLGNPDDINTSVYGEMKSEQLVYGYNYIYIENDAVTSYQLD